MGVANGIQYPEPYRTWKIRWLPARGPSLDLNDMTRFYAVERHGFGIPPPVVSVLRGIGQPGDTITQIYAQPRTLEVPTHLFPRAESMNSLRYTLALAMDYTLGDGTIEYTDRSRGVVWTCTARPDAMLLDTAAREANDHLERLRWIAHDPRWFAPDELTYLTASGATYEIVNRGTQNAGWVLTIPGPINNPTFYNDTTGELIAIRVFVDPDHSLQITAIPNQKNSLLIWHTNQSISSVYPDPHAGSVYWQLAPGSNLLRLTGLTPEGVGLKPATFVFAPSVLGV